MSESFELTDRILEMVRELRPDQLRQRPIGVDEDLRAAGLNSLATVRLMMDVEVAFDIAIPNEDLHPDNFRSVRAVASLVSRLGAAAA
jgi:acyl carrier protein